MPFEPLHHKYRPQTFADLVGQETVVTTLANAIRQERIAPAYLFTGPRGTGKTSSARILAKSLNCLQSNVPIETPCGRCEVCQAIARGIALDVIEIDAASNTGVDNIRDLIERAQFAPVQCRYKVYVIDECHMLSTAAFNALLKTLEEPPARVVFVLATTDPQRVLPTIISRCQRFDFRRIPLAAMVSHLRAIAIQENINIADNAVDLVAQTAQGGLRDAESLLDQLSLLPGQITPEQVWDLVGAVPEQDLLVLLTAIAALNPEAILDQTRHLMDRGREPLIVLQNLAGFYRDLLIAKTAPARNDLVSISLSVWTKLCDLAEAMDISTILAAQQHLRTGEAQLKTTTQPRLWLEVILLGLLSSLVSHPAGEVVQPVITPVRALQPDTSPTQSAASRLKSPERIQQSAHPVTLAAGPGGTEAQRQQPVQQPMRAEAPVTAQLTSAEAETPPISIQPPPSLPLIGENSQNKQELATEISTASAQASDRNYRSPATDAAKPNLEQVWQQVVVHLYPPGTQALLRQQGVLLAFDGQKAKIGISSQPLFKMAQARLTNVEAAFQKAFNCQVKASLEVVVSTEPKVSLLNEQPTGNAASIKLKSVADTEATIEADAPSNLSAADTQAQMNGPTANPLVEVTEFSGHAIQHPSPAKTFLNPSDVPAPQTPGWQENNEVSRAAKSMAHFFNGEIVNQEQALEGTQSTLPSNDPDQSYNLVQPLLDTNEPGFLDPDEFDQSGQSGEVPF